MPAATKTFVLNLTMLRHLFKSKRALDCFAASVRSATATAEEGFLLVDGEILAAFTHPRTRREQLYAQLRNRVLRDPKFLKALKARLSESQAGRDLVD